MCIGFWAICTLVFGCHVHWFLGSMCIGFGGAMYNGFLCPFDAWHGSPSMMHFKPAAIIGYGMDTHTLVSTGGLNKCEARNNLTVLGGII